MKLSKGACKVGEKASSYIEKFTVLLHEADQEYARYAGSLVCSLPKSEFDVWVDVRKQIDLGETDWP